MDERRTSTDEPENKKTHDDVLYTHIQIQTETIKHNLRTSMNERTNTLLYKNISLTLYSRKGWCFCGMWEMGGETYTKREDVFFSYLLGSHGCQRLQPLASSSETPLIGCVFLARLRFSALSVNLTVWFLSSRLLPVTHLLYPNALMCFHPVYSSQRDSLSRHTGSLGTNRKSMSYVA